MQNDMNLDELAAEMRVWRQDIHQHPEIGFNEHRTSAKVANLLRSWGIEVHTGLGGTGVVGTIHGKFGPGLTIGLRADMDALPMQEKTNLPYSSTNSGVFHGCGHDGHTSILLGVSKYLAQWRGFRGTVQLIFQPAEEVLRGGPSMIADGLFEKFPCDEIYALHNNNKIPLGKIGVRAGTLLAACAMFRITIKGIGSHAAMPDKSIDPIVAGAALVQALQTIVSRNIDPLASGVVSICKFHAGEVLNVIPDTAVLEGTARALGLELQEKIFARMRETCAGVATAYDCDVNFEILQSGPPTINAEGPTETVRLAAERVVGAENVINNAMQVMAAEDFAFMLQCRPGSYFYLGHDGLTCHHPEFDFDDNTLPTGAAVFIEIIRERLA